MLVLWKTLCFFCAVSVSLDHRPLVTTTLGKIRGHHKKSFSQRKFSAFEGIPYALAPIGQNRFEEPRPIENWAGVWEATFLIECAQIQFTTRGLNVTGDEDCLYLNVYVPREHVNSSEGLDVIVHIHGGAFMIGSGHSYAFPGFLMDHDAIFVTFNYRLGILGFLSTEDDIVPGNNGLKDQVLALRWIRNHIASFGGNPDSVTLTGASAGGASVHLHYMSPMSRGLFRNGLSQSGCALDPWVFQRDASLKAKILASSVGCPEQPTRDLVKCLKERNHHEILAKTCLFYEYKYLPLVPFGPVVEKGPKSFLAQTPRDLLKAKQVQNLPWVASFVKHDGGALVNVFRHQMNELNKIWKNYAPFLLHYNYTAPRAKWESLSGKIQEFYLGRNKEFSHKNYDALVKIVTDRNSARGTVEAVDLQSKATNASVYLYEMSYTGDTKKTVEHGDDLQYFYYNSMGKVPRPDELEMKDVMMKMLLTFANTGKPLVDDVVWEPVQEHKLQTLHFSGPNSQDIELRTNEDLDQEFWNSLGLTER